MRKIFSKQNYLFSKEVLNKLENKNIIESKLDIYHTFAQSHDYLFYYKFGTKHKEINKLGRYAHHNKTQEYILNIIKEIKNKKGVKEAVRYIYSL